MKTITKYLLPRYIWFLAWYKQWFRNTEGIKGFAAQVMNWLLQRTMALAEKLTIENKKMAEIIKTKNAQLKKCYEHAIVNADEWDEVKGTVRKLGFWVFVGIATEAACNYFAMESVMEGRGLFWALLRALSAIGITGLCLYFFERWFALVINEPAYKQTKAKLRNFTELVTLTFVCIGFEMVFYWLCKKRSEALIGSTHDDTTTHFLILLGMLLPIGAGYLAYKRNYYKTPYNNTLRIINTEKIIAKNESHIVTNSQRMEDHFKREVEDSWGLLQEYKVYKENYNLKNSINEESLVGHFCENHESFEREAVHRYQKAVLHQTPLQPTLIISQEQMNGHDKQLTTAFSH